MHRSPRRLTPDGGHKGVRFATVGEKGTVRVWTSGSSSSVYDGPQDAAAAAEEATFSRIQLLPGAAGFCVTVSDGRVLFYEAAGAHVERKGGRPAAGAAEAAGKPRLALARTLIGNLGDVVDARFLPGGNGARQRAHRPQLPSQPSISDRNINPRSERWRWETFARDHPCF